MTIAAYAAGASLAAVTLVYVFAPTFFLDDDGTGSSRKRSAVGLSNPANDCFINSVLQALAGLGEFRVYLIKELHRRQKDGREVYKITPEDIDGKRTREQLVRLQGLREGVVTQALKDILDKLNERPIYKKTISARDFVYSLEHAFGTRISRQQQDAQEMLHLVAERLCDEYHLGLKARRRTKKEGLLRDDLKAADSPGVSGTVPVSGESLPIDEAQSISLGSDQEVGTLATRTATDASTLANSTSTSLQERDDEDNTFPFEGTMESQVECQTCHFKPRPNTSSFVTLTLNVPVVSSTTLDSCFDGLLKLEVIDDYTCDRCRLEHALAVTQRRAEQSSNELEKQGLEEDAVKLATALKEDPEKPPEGVCLPNTKLVPKRRIARHTRIKTFPRILAVHLSRSIYDSSNHSMKNMAKVQFPEHLRLGGFDMRNYRLLAVVTHKGGHNSGHYETFRRQSFNQQGPHSSSSQPGSPSIAALDARTSLAANQAEVKPSVHLARMRAKKPKINNKWWRISDDRIKECKLSDVLGMQREIYLLFYELEAGG